MKQLKKYLRQFLNMLLKPSKKFYSKGVIPLYEIAKYLPVNPVIIEAGAYIGNDTLEMSKVWPKGRIYAFEPVPMLYEKLVVTFFLRKQEGFLLISAYTGGF